MKGYKRILVLSSILILSLLIGWGFNHSNSLISSGSVAYSAVGTDDQLAAESDEQTAGDTDDQQLPGVETNTGSILLPQKRTILLGKTQLRGYASYQYYCAVCHGKGGGGNGSNAKNLSIPPRKHNDAPYMANLSDAYLSRIIKEGGASQGLSPLMPPWGGALNDEEISNLIAFLRILPDRQMVASVEKHQKSAGMGGHHGGAEAEGHHATGTDDHQAAEADEHTAAGTDDHHADPADDHKATTTDDHPVAETDDHKSEGAADQHADEADDHKDASGTDDHHETDVDEHKEPSTDDHDATETDDHQAANADDHHGAEAGEQHEAGSEDSHTD
ncbi:MAG: c-type cytochrome [Desulfobacterales bacterium]